MLEGHRTTISRAGCKIRRRREKNRVVNQWEEAGVGKRKGRDGLVKGKQAMKGYEMWRAVIFRERDGVVVRFRRRVG